MGKWTAAFLLLLLVVLVIANTYQPTVVEDGRKQLVFENETCRIWIVISGDDKMQPPESYKAPMEQGAFWPGPPIPQRKQVVITSPDGPEEPTDALYPSNGIEHWPLWTF